MVAIVDLLVKDTQFKKASTVQKVRNCGSANDMAKTVQNGVMVCIDELVPIVDYA